VNKRFTSAFSLVELTAAIGIAAFCLIGVFGLMPVAVLTNRNATSQTRATNILAAIVADLRATTKTPGTWTGTSSQFCIPIGTSTTLYFDTEGRCSSDLAGSTSPCGLSWTPALQTRCRLNITFPSAGNLTYADLKVTWPAPAMPANASGSVEILAALDRN
jgi:type II secretory pathway pseudopilin PulG